jgi:WD40 repeat protein
MRNRSLLALALCLPLVLAATPEASASFPGHDGLIVYSAEGDLWVVRADGTGRRQLTSGPADDGFVAWSPDGKRIVFRRDGWIHTMKANGRRIRNTHVEGTDPRWYPDGTKIVFWDQFGVSTIRPNGTGRRLILENVFTDDFAHVFRTPSYSVEGYLEATEFEAVRNESGELVQTLADIRVEAPPPRYDCLFVPDNAEWSPDGRKLAVVGIAGQLCLTDGVSGPDFPSAGAFDVEWSPEGDRLALGQGQIVDLDGNVLVDDLFSSRIHDVAWQPRCTVEGTAGHDVLTGTDGDDVICGLGGDDTLFGLGGADVVYGGSGDDYLAGGPGDDLLYGGFNADRLFGRGGADFVSAGPGSDVRCNGGSGIDRSEGCEVSARIP